MEDNFVLISIGLYWFLSEYKGNPRHVCANHRNVTHPLRTKRTFCKPTYKKYMVRCGNQWCEGVKLVYEKYHKEIVSNTNHTYVDYQCCPGWTQVSWKSHGCNKPVCSTSCMHGGKCIKPNVCSCLPGYYGPYCEHKTSVYAPTNPCCYPSTCPPVTVSPPTLCPQCLCLYSSPTPCLSQPVPVCPPECGSNDVVNCVPPCQNGGTCAMPAATCKCPPGYTGGTCGQDVNECLQKPCDQICYNTPGSFKCECKESFVLQKDGQTCRKENYDGTALEANDLEQQKYDKVDRRLQKLEKMLREKSKNEVTKKDLNGIYGNIDRITNDISNIAEKLQKLEIYGEEIDELRDHVNLLDKRTVKCKSHAQQQQTDCRSCRPRVCHSSSCRSESC